MAHSIKTTNHLSKPVAVAPRRLGDQLKTARLSKRINLETASQATKIRMSSLEALEANRWEGFPAEVYLLGFLKKYSQFLGLKPEEIIELYNAQKREVVLDNPTGQKPQSEKAPRENSSTSLNPLLIWTGASIFTFSLLLILFHGRTISPSLPSKAEAPAIEHTLSVLALRNAWLSVSSQERRIFEGIIPAASLRTWKSPVSFQIRTHKAADLRVEIDGAPLDVAQAEGQDMRVPNP